MLLPLNDAIVLFYLGLKCDSTVVSGFGVASAFYKIFGMSVQQSVWFSIQGDVGQQIGAKDLTSCAVLLNRSRLILSVFMLPLLIIFYHVDDILKSMGINRHIAH